MKKQIDLETGNEMTCLRKTPRNTHFLCHFSVPVPRLSRKRVPSSANSSCAIIQLFERQKRSQYFKYLKSNLTALLAPHISPEKYSIYVLQVLVYFKIPDGERFQNLSVFIFSVTLIQIISVILHSRFQCFVSTIHCLLCNICVTHPKT